MNVLNAHDTGIRRTVAMVALIEPLQVAKNVYQQDPNAAAIISDLGLVELFDIYIQQLISGNGLPESVASSVVELNMGAHDDVALHSVTRIFMALDLKIKEHQNQGFHLENFNTMQFEWDFDVWEALLVFRGV